MNNTTATQSNTETVPSFAVALFAAVEQYYDNPLSVKAVKAFKKSYRRFGELILLDDDRTTSNEKNTPTYALDLYVRAGEYRRNPHSKKCKDNLDEVVDTFRDLMPIRNGIVCEEPNTL